MTFTGSDEDIVRLTEACFGITAADEVGYAVAQSLVLEIGGEPFRVREDARSLYHAALAHAGNHVITVLLDAVEALRAALTGQELLGQELVGTRPAASPSGSSPRWPARRWRTRSNADRERSRVRSRAVTPTPSPDTWMPLPKSLPNWPRRIERTHCAPRSGPTPPKTYSPHWQARPPRGGRP